MTGSDSTGLGAAETANGASVVSFANRRSFVAPATAGGAQSIARRPGIEMACDGLAAVAPLAGTKGVSDACVARLKAALPLNCSAGRCHAIGSAYFGAIAAAGSAT